MLADTSLADTDVDKEKDVNGKEEEDIGNEEEDVDDQEEDVNNDEKGNKDAINNMPPKLKSAAATPPKKTIEKELEVD